MVGVLGGRAETQVGQQRPTIGGEHDVARADVIVRKRSPFGIRQCLGNRRQEGDQLTGTERTSPVQQVRQRTSRRIVADNQPLPRHLTYLDHTNHVRMVETTRQRQVTPQHLRCRYDRDRHALDHHEPARGQVTRQPGGASRAGPQRPPDPVPVDLVDVHVQKGVAGQSSRVEVIHNSARRRLATVADIRYVEGDFGADAVEYETAWAEQRRLHAGVVAGYETDTVILLEHPPVYTAGKRTEPHERPFDGTPVVDVDRGGKITWHGPGQLVGYPIVRLASHVYVVDYVRRLEEALIRVCRDFGVQDAARVKGRSGVWLPADDRRPERKVAAIGIRVAQGVTMHGFALNCDPDLTWFDRIVPCGISDAGVTSLTAELDRDVTVRDVLEPTRRHLDELLSWAPYVRTPDIEHGADIETGAVSYGLAPLR